MVAPTAVLMDEINQIYLVAQDRPGKWDNDPRPRRLADETR